MPHGLLRVDKVIYGRPAAQAVAEARNGRGG
jgi:hypothetical protein